MHGGRRHQPNAGVAMLAVVPGEEPLAEDTGVLEAAEACREVRPVFQCLELGLRKGVVIEDLGPRMTPRHPEIRQQQCYGLAGHGRAPIGMEA